MEIKPLSAEHHWLAVVQQCFVIFRYASKSNLTFRSLAQSGLIEQWLLFTILTDKGAKLLAELNARVAVK